MRGSFAQARALRERRPEQLDWENLAEEIESSGKSDRRELTSQITRILRHLLKLAVSPTAEPRAGWRESIGDARTAVELVLGDSPGLRREVEDVIRKQTPTAVTRAAADLAQHGEPAEALWARLEQGGFTAEQVVGDWFPDPPG